MTGLSAVCPDRVGIVHLNGKRRERGGVSSDGHADEKYASANTRRRQKGEHDVQPRVKADLAARGSGCDLLARRGEARLRHSVVLLVELKGDGIARLRGNICRLEGQNVRATNYNPVILGGGGRSGRGTGSGGSDA